MTCAELRAMAESYLAGELPVDTNHEVITHLEQCADCRAELARRVALRTTLRRAFLHEESLAPSAALVDRVHALARSPVASPRRAGGAASWLMLAAGIALAVTAAWQFWPSRTARAPAALAALAAHAAGDHRNCALEHALADAPISLDEAGRRYDPAYATLLAAVRDATPMSEGVVELLGGHWCVFEGMPFAHIVVRQNGHVVSILLTPVTQAEVERADTGPCPPAGGFQVACFGAPRHAGFVVSDLADGDILSIARAVAPILQRHLTRG